MQSVARRLIPAVVVAAGLAACGGSTTNSSSAPSAGGDVTVAGVPVRRDPAVRKLLPARIRQAGVIRVASNAPYPPFVKFKSEGSQVFAGADVDLANALGAVLGVRFAFSQLPFDGMIPAVQAGKSDVVMGGLSDTRSREKVLDFVDYSQSGLKLITTKGNPKGLRGLDGLCGLPVSAQGGTEQADKLAALNRSTCASEPIKVITVPQEPDAQLALKSGRADAELTGAVGAVEAVRQSQGAFEAVPSAPAGYDAQPNGIGVRKNDRGLRDALRGALAELMASGAYRKLLDSQRLGYTALASAQVNAARR